MKNKSVHHFHCWLVFILNFLIYSCGAQDDLIGKKILASYSGPELKMPLPPGYKWFINVPVGGRYGMGPNDVDQWHTGNGYYSIDFDDDIKNDGTGDLGEDKVDVLAAADGRVAEVVNNGCSQHGTVCKVIIDHEGTGYQTIYLHLANGSVVVNEGDLVKQGQKIAKLGNTGDSSGPHLHFQIKHADTNGVLNSARSNPYFNNMTLEGASWESFQVDDFYLSNNSFHFDPENSNYPYFCYNQPVFNGGGYSCNRWNGFEPGSSVWINFQLLNLQKDVCLKVKWYLGTDQKFESEGCSTDIEQNGGSSWVYYFPNIYPINSGTWEARVYVRLKQNTDYLDVPIVKKNFTVLTPTAIPNTPTILRLISPNFPQSIESTGDPVIIEWTRMDNAFWYKLYLWLYYPDTGWEMSGDVNYIYGLNAVRIGGAAPRTYGAWAVKACNQLGCSPLSRIGFYFYDP